MGPARVADAPLKVLQLVSSARRRGAEVFAYQLSEQLEHRGMQVTTIALERSDDPSDLPFLQPRHTRFDPRTIARLARLARANDVVISHAGSTLLPTAIASTLARRPYVFRNIGDPRLWGQVRGADVRLGMPLRHSAHVVALFPEAARYLTETYRIPAIKVTVGSNAVDAARFGRRTESDRLAARAGLGLGPGPTVGYLGALTNEKRPEWAVRAVKDLPGVTLVVAGQGPLRPALEQEAADAGIKDRVRFLGPVSDPGPFLHAIDALVIPSETEGVPGAMIEAAMVGVPVVATDVGGVSDFIRQTEVGVVAPVDDLEALVAGLSDVLQDNSRFVAPRTALEARFDIRSIAVTWAQILSSAGTR